MNSWRHFCWRLWWQNITDMTIIYKHVCVPGWCSGSPGRGSAGCTQTLFLEKMISPSSTVRDPPVPTLNVKRSEALEDARRRSRPNDISSSERSLLPSSERGTKTEPQIMRLLHFLSRLFTCWTLQMTKWKWEYLFRKQNIIETLGW